jgi:Type ISP C-terminal specificity domain/N-6 DNA Methylase
MSNTHGIFERLETFAQAVKAKFSQHVGGEEEERLRQPFENFMEAAGLALGLPQKLVCSGEVHTGEGRPDYGINLDKLLTGYAELKAPGKGVTESRMKGADKAQFKRFMAYPNLLYCDGNEWALYRSGERVDIVKLNGDIATQGKAAVSIESAEKLEALLRKYLAWRPFIPTNRRGQVDLQEFAKQLAPLCRLLRDDVTDALKVEDSPLRDLAKDWRQLLFPDAEDERFADAYAQTVTFALLLGRSDGADPLTRESAEKGLAAEHGLLSRALKVLTDDAAYKQIKPSVDLLLRYIGEVPRGIFENVTEAQGRGRATGAHDPWLYFYEDFLAVYDAKLRKDAGAYYTPVEVVHAQVRLIDDLLRGQLGKPQGFASPDVITLDPAVGTGTYLLGVIEHALGRVEKEQGAGAVPGHATTLAANLHGFEIMVGPYAVSELRVSRMLKDRGATLPKEGTHIFLTDTLESPHAKPTQLPLYLRPISEQHERALKVKSNTPVIVCLGNPPYDRHSAESRLGGWVRYGDPLRAEEAPILSDFIEPARAAGHGVHIKNLYNLYVYFWRWALWKVFEHDTAKGPGVVSFISASSYIDGDAFSGMREHLRRQCDEIWVLDIGGEGRGTRQTDNVFNIQTPVAISVAVRRGKAQPDKPAKVHYAVIDGTRAEKLTVLDAMQGLRDVKWEPVPDDWQAPFRPTGAGVYFDSPLLIDLMPWQHSGVQLKRTWPIAESVETLDKRWRALLNTENRSTAFRGSGDREATGTYKVKLVGEPDSTPIASLPKNAPLPPTVRYAYRSFDRQHIIADGRLMSRPRPDLWQSHSSTQVFLTSMLTVTLGSGMAVAATSAVPDLHYLLVEARRMSSPSTAQPMHPSRTSCPDCWNCLAQSMAAVAPAPVAPAPSPVASRKTLARGPVPLITQSYPLARGQCHQILSRRRTSWPMSTACWRRRPSRRASTRSLRRASCACR